MIKTKIYEFRIPNIIYGYSISQSKDDLLYLTYEKWCDGKSWNYNLPPSWEEYRTDTAVHIYQNIDQAKSDGNVFLMKNAALKIIEINEYKIVLFWNQEKAKAEKMPYNNLFIFDKLNREVWSIKDYMGSDEMCTGVNKISDDTFYFTTFDCVGFTMRISDNQIECVKKIFTR